MSHDPSRKQFFAKLLGAAAAVSVAPQLVAKSSPAVAPQVPSAAPAMPVAVIPQSRAVARRADSV